MQSILRHAYLFLLGVTLFWSTILLTSHGAMACSRMLWADNGQAVMVGRTVDWPIGLKSELWVFPRGMKRDAQVVNPMVWTSKYASIAAACFFAPGKAAVLDGMNEKGLSANTLWMAGADFGPRDKRVQGLTIGLWVQYYLDNFATVDEALRAFDERPYQIAACRIPRQGAQGMEGVQIHLSLADKTGDSAVIEYVNGKRLVYHDRRYAVMTNEPRFEEQRANLSRYEGFGGSLSVPGTSNSDDRFVRASYYLKRLPRPRDLREALACILSVARNVSVTYQMDYDPVHPNLTTTLWRSVTDLTHGTYYFDAAASTSMIWAALKDFNLEEGAAPVRLEVDNGTDISGDVARRFTKAEPFEFLK
jgi:penicillin V acylase-like amidase (Ntn superfamily)